jgi:hypothetical protein
MEAEAIGWRTRVHGEFPHSFPLSFLPRRLRQVHTQTVARSRLATQFTCISAHEYDPQFSFDPTETSPVTRISYLGGPHDWLCISLSLLFSTNFTLSTWPHLSTHGVWLISFFLQTIFYGMGGQVDGEQKYPRDLSATHSPGSCRLVPLRVPSSHSHLRHHL